MKQNVLGRYVSGVLSVLMALIGQSLALGCYLLNFPLWPNSVEDTSHMPAAVGLVG